MEFMYNGMFGMLNFLYGVFFLKMNKRGDIGRGCYNWVGKGIFLFFCKSKYGSSLRM